MWGQATEYAEARVRLNIRSRCGRNAARNLMTLQKSRPTLSGKQSDEYPETRQLSKVPVELSFLGSKQLFLTSSHDRVGSKHDVCLWDRGDIKLRSHSAQPLGYEACHRSCTSGRISKSALPNNSYSPARIQ